MADHLIIVPTDDGLGWRALLTDSTDRVVVNHLKTISSLVPPYGSSFPGAPIADQLFWRTDTSVLWKRNSGNTAWDPVSAATDLGLAADYPHGFVDQTSSTISFVYGTLTFTITPVGSFTFYWQGQKYVKSGAENKVLAGTDGLHYVYYDNTGALQESTTPWNLQLHVPVATVYINTTLGAALLQEERHMTNMDWSTHFWMHNTIGCRFKSGLAASGYVLNSDTDADVTFGLSDGTILDEDIIVDIKHAAVPANPFEQILTDPAQIPVFYRVGANGIWTWDAPTNFWVKNGGTTRVSYNEYSGGVWQQTDGSNGNYIAYWIFATANLINPVISIQGQRTDVFINDARANNTLESLNLGGLPAAELKALYRFIVRTNSGYGGTRHFMISDVADYRSTSAVPGTYVPTSHASLGDLNISGHPADVVSVDTTSFGGQIPTTSNTVQTALQSTNDHTHGIKSGIVPAASFAGNPKKATVTFVTAYPDTNYAVAHVIYTNGAANAAYIATIENKTVNGFDISLHTGNIGNVVDVEWITRPVGE